MQHLLPFFVLLGCFRCIFDNCSLLFNQVNTSFQVMRTQHGVEFSMKELNSTSWKVGETPNVSILSDYPFLWFCFLLLCLWSWWNQNFSSVVCSFFVSFFGRSHSFSTFKSMYFLWLIMWHNRTMLTVWVDSF